jgi:hypothetical protein
MGKRNNDMARRRGFTRKNFSQSAPHLWRGFIGLKTFGYAGPKRPYATMQAYDKV